jgi:hypothetical protein
MRDKCRDSAPINSGMRDSTRSKIEVDLRLEHPVDLSNCSLSIEVVEFLNIKSFR